MSHAWMDIILYGPGWLAFPISVYLLIEEFRGDSE
jgi:hypothetical protein